MQIVGRAQPPGAQKDTNINRISTEHSDDEPAVERVLLAENRYGSGDSDQECPPAHQIS
jgi:hypothetical protein